MRRRDFITLLGGAAAAWPLPAMPSSPRFRSSVSSVQSRQEGFSDRLRGFREGLREAGYLEGNNVAIDFRWAENRLERLPELGADLVRRQVSVIVGSGGTAGALNAKSLNTTIPVVFGIPENPVELGLVASLSRPGGTMTGVNFFVGEVLAKRLDSCARWFPRPNGSRCSSTRRISASSIAGAAIGRGGPGDGGADPRL